MENPTVTSVLSLQLGSAITSLFPSESAVNLCPLSNRGKGEAWPGGTLQSKKGSEVFRNEQRKKGISLEDQRLPQIPLCWSIPAHTCVKTVRKRDWSRGDEKGGWEKNLYLIESREHSTRLPKCQSSLTCSRVFVPLEIRFDSQVLAQLDNSTIVTRVYSVVIMLGIELWAWHMPRRWYFQCSFTVFLPSSSWLRIAWVCELDMMVDTCKSSTRGGWHRSSWSSLAKKWI